MNFRQVETFRAVMMTGSASRAAEVLRITQPAVSRSVGELERALGFALFNRIKGRLVPTAEGQLFYRDVSNSFSGLDTLRSAAARIRDFGSGAIKIASLSALGSTLVPRAIKAFRTSHPEIAITLQVLSSSAVRNLVAGGQFDIGLAADEVDLSGVDHQAFASVRAVCAIPIGHRLALYETITPQDLHEEPFIALAPEDSARHRMNLVFEAAGSRPKVVIETPSSSTICALALEGVGVGLTNPLAADGFVERGLILRPFEPEVPFKSLLLLRPDTQKSLIVRAMVQALLDARFGRR
jgi:DNA-binding transcriptional LysR family regulator